MTSLVEDTKDWVLVSLERSRLLRSSIPDRILQPRPVVTLRERDDGPHSARVQGPRFSGRCAGSQDGEPNLVSEWPSSGVAVHRVVPFFTWQSVMSSQPSSCQIDRRPHGPLYATMPQDFVVEKLQPDQLFRGPRRSWSGRLIAAVVANVSNISGESSYFFFLRNPLNPCVFLLWEPESREGEASPPLDADMSVVRLTALAPLAASAEPCINADDQWWSGNVLGVCHGGFARHVFFPQGAVGK